MEKNLHESEGIKFEIFKDKYNKAMTCKNDVQLFSSWLVAERSTMTDENITYHTLFRTGLLF